MHEGNTAWRASNLTNIGAHQHGADSAGAKMHQLFPHLRHNIGHSGRHHAGRRAKGCRYALNPRTHAARGLAKGQPTPIIQMPYRAIGREARLDFCNPTQNTLSTEDAL